MAWTRTCFAGLLVWLAACDSPSEPEPEPVIGGTLQRGEFRYHCAGSNDAFCEDFQANRFPGAFAVGGTFEVTFEPTVNVPAIPVVESSAPEFLAPGRADATYQFRFERPGTAGLLAVVNTDEIVDYVHIRGERVVSYHFKDDEGGDGVAEITLQPGQQRTITVEPRGELGQALAGTLDYAWSTDDDAVAVVSSDATARSVQLRAVELGTTRLLVVGGEVMGSVQVRVVDDPPDTETETDTDTTSGTDGDTDTDTDTDGDTDTETDTDTDTDGGSTSSSTGGSR